MIQDDVDFVDDLDDIFPSVSNIAFSSAISASLETNSSTINLSESSPAAGNLNNADKVMKTKGILKKEGYYLPLKKPHHIQRSCLHPHLQ